MNILIDHLEYLLRRHDCVTVPGIGALMVRHKPARFDERNPLILLPPSRDLVFNGAIVESDGVLESSVARRDGVSFEVARRIVNEEAEVLLQQLRAFGSLVLGHLGELTYTEYGTVVFSPYDVSGWDFRYYGLRPLYLKSADSISCSGFEMEILVGENISGETSADVRMLPPIPNWQREEERESEDIATSGRRSLWSRSIVGIAASLAVIVTLALFILNPIKVENEPLKASLAPTDKIQHTDPVDLLDVETVLTEERAATFDSIATLVEAIESSAVEPANDEEAVAVKIAQHIETSGNRISSPTEFIARFQSNDPYCVIVASFPAEAQANRYISENQGKKLGILQKDGKYRVYAATGSTYKEATAQKEHVGNPDAWICSR